MIEHAWTVIADRSVIDRDSNNLSIDVLEQIGVGEIPADLRGAVIPIRVEIVSLWYRENRNEPERGRARLFLRAPDRPEPLSMNEFDLDLTQFSRLRTRFGVAGLPFTTPGLYFFHVERASGDQWTQVARVPIEIVAVDAQADDQRPGAG